MNKLYYSNKHGLGFITVVALIACMLTLVACTDSKNATRILEDEGLTSVQITGYKWFACSKDDTYHTGFTAIKTGKQVNGVVCAGLFFKGSTVRYF